MTNLDGAPVLLRNDDPSPGHWIRIRTVGAKSNRDGFGAKVEVTAEGTTQYAEVRSGSSFESASDPRVHFGLGTATQIEGIVVRWPSGHVDKLGPATVDREISVEEGHLADEKHPPPAAQSVGR